MVNKQICGNCLDTGIEKGVYSNHSCSFCREKHTPKVIKMKVDGEITMNEETKEYTELNPYKTNDY